MTLERWLLMSFVSDVAVSVVLVACYAFVLYAVWRGIRGK